MRDTSLKKVFSSPPRPFSPSPLLPPSFPLSSRVSPAMLAAKRQDGGLFKGPPYPGYPFIMIPDLSSPYLPNGSLSPTARTVSAFFFFFFVPFLPSSPPQRRAPRCPRSAPAPPPPPPRRKLCELGGRRREGVCLHFAMLLLSLAPFLFFFFLNLIFFLSLNFYFIVFFFFSLFDLFLLSVLRAVCWSPPMWG